MGFWLKWPAGRGGCELHARRGRGVRGSAQLGRRLRGEDGADSPGPRAEREGKAGAGARKAAGDGPREEECGREGEEVAGLGWEKAQQGGEGFFSFSFYFLNPISLFASFSFEQIMLWVN